MKKLLFYFFLLINNSIYCQSSEDAKKVLDDVSKKISSFENDNSLAVNMGKNGREFIQKEYSLNASAENFLRIIKPYIQKN